MQVRLSHSCSVLAVTAFLCDRLSLAGCFSTKAAAASCNKRYGHLNVLNNSIDFASVNLLWEFFAETFIKNFVVSLCCSL